MLKKVKAILENAGDRTDFFRIIASIFPTRSPEYKLIERAYDAGKDAFRGDLRESGERYFEHLRAVSLILCRYLMIEDHETIGGGLLHDNVEDKPEWTVARVALEFGEGVALIVESVSTPLDLFPDKGKCLEVFHRRLAKSSRRIISVKLADRLHNLLTLWVCSEEKKLRKIKETKRFYLPLAREHCILYHELLAAIEELEADPVLEEEPGGIPRPPEKRQPKKRVRT
jgi:(p)ppGpp synthase/HD superfamily hydrolase